MKLFLALVGGFAMTLVVFAAGAVLATVYFVGPDTERNETAAIWSNEPVRVAYAGADNDAPRAAKDTSAQASEEEGDAGIDLITTAAVAAENPQGTAEAEATARQSAELGVVADAHRQWCSDRYRSFRAEDNSYQPYGGPRQACVSPYTSELQALEAPRSNAAPVQQLQARMQFADEARGMPMQIDRDHIQSCFDRYRSYRPEDNSYQPYNGGPRRQCM